MVEATILARLRDAVSEDGPGPFHHFTVDGTLIEAWASLKSLRPKGEQPSDRTPPADPGNPSVDFHGERRQNATHQSTTDPEVAAGEEGRRQRSQALLHRNVPDGESQRHYDRSSLGRPADGQAESEQGLEMLPQSFAGRAGSRLLATRATTRRRSWRVCRALNVTPHVAQNGAGRAARRSTSHLPIGLATQSANGMQTGRGDLRLDQDGRQLPSHALSGRRADQFAAYLVGAAYNLLRIAKLCPSG